MAQNTTTAKRLAKNTMFMYCRMVLLMIISLYTSRLILQALGVSDYGIYNVVGSVVVMFNSLRTIFSSSTQRFLNYEMGRGNLAALKEIFNISIKINIYIALLFLFIVECVGIWFLMNKFNADSNRIIAATIVLQFSIISAIFSIFTTSFDAEVVAHERMEFYAYMAIIDASLRMGIVFIVKAFTGDRLILYGFLMLICTIITFLCNFIFCRKNFKEVRFERVGNSIYLKKMTKFAGWNFFGNTAFAVCNSGINMVLNVFGGPVVNAARGIAYQITQQLQMINNNIAIVINPFAIKTYAGGNKEKLFSIVYLSSKIYMFIQVCINVFFTLFATEIISIWLGQVPQYLITFLTIVLWHSIIRSLHNPIDLIFKAFGTLKAYQIIEAVILSLPVIFSYISLKYGCPFYSVFLVICSFEIINLILIILLANKISGLSICVYFLRVLVPTTICISIYAAIFYIVHNIDANLSGKLVIGLIGYSSLALFMYIGGLSQDEKAFLNSILKRTK